MSETKLEEQNVNEDGDKQDVADPAQDQNTSDDGESGGSDTEQERTSEPITEESLARRRGWKPRSEWQGTIPPNFVDDAAEFNSNHEQQNPRLLAENRRLTDELGRLESKFDDRLNVLVSQGRRAERETVLAEMRSAAEEADVESFDKAKDKLQALEDTETPAAKKEAPPANYDPQQDPNFRNWHAENTWYGSDRRKTQFAEQVAAQEVLARGIKPDTHGAQFYNEVSKVMDESFGTAKKAAPKVDDNNPSPARRKAGKPAYSSLPAEAKSEFKWMVGRGYMKNDEKAREQYAAEYVELAGKKE